MPKSIERQVSFAGGELSPDLWGRTDIQKYQSGCRTAKNFFVTPYGTLMNRPGSMFVYDVPLNLVQANPKVRVVPFIFSDEDALLLVFAWHQFQVFRYNPTTGAVEATEPGVSHETPYENDDLANLRFAQQGDVIVVVHPDYRPREIRRYSNTEWTFEVIDFSVPEFPTYGGTPVVTGFGEEDDAHPKREWVWAVTRVMRTASGHYYETLPTTPQACDLEIYNWLLLGSMGRHIHTTESGFVIAFEVGDIICMEPGSPSNRKWYRANRVIWAVHDGDHSTNFEVVPGFDDGYYWGEITDGTHVAGLYVPRMCVLYADRPVTITWGGLFTDINDPEADDDTIVETRIYRGREGHFGYVGSSNDTDFVDDGSTPDFTTPPPLGENPFRGEYPSVVSYHGGRRFFGALTNRPATTLGSAVEEYSNFDMAVPAKDSSSLEFEVATGKFEKIRALISRDGLLVFTDNSESLVGGSGQSEVLTPYSIARRPISKHGSGLLEPVEVGDYIVFVQRKGTVPRAMDALSSFAVEDMSVFSRHLFTGHTIVSWCYAEDPWNLLWVVRDDGVLLSCTFMPKQHMLAWTEHEIVDGIVEGVCSLPEGTEDAVYLVVRRGTHLCIERLASCVLTDVRNAKFVDCGTTYDGRNTDNTHTVKVQSTDPAIINPNDDVYVTITEDVEGEHINKIVRVYTNDEQTAWFEVRLTSSEDPGLYVGTLVDALPAAFNGVTTTNWAFSIEQIAVPAILNDSQLMALIDGNVAGPFTVVAGKVAFGQTERAGIIEPDRTGAVVVIGLGYDSDFESLDMVQDKSRQKNVGTVYIETNGSRGGFAGATLDEEMLKELPLRRVSDNYETVALRHENVKVNIPSRWEETGRVCYRQSNPVPITILGITREVEVGG